MKVWLVTADLYEHPYGAEIHALGVFSSEDKANECVKNSKTYCVVTELELDKMISDLSKTVFLGGCIE